MVVEIWSDLTCPFCYIGKKRFENAVRKMDGPEKMVVVHKSYLLDPQYHQPGGESMKDYLIRSKRLDAERFAVMTAQIEEMAKQEGLTIDLNRTIPANTQKAHRLLQFAAQSGKSSALLDRLYQAHFSEGVNLEDESELRRLGNEMGISEEQTDHVFQDDQLAYRVGQDVQQARHIGVQGVPFFVFDQRYAVSGAQPIEAFEEVIAKCIDESNTASAEGKKPDGMDGTICDENGCEV